MILRHYGVWRELGDIPREVWPENVPVELSRQVQKMSEGARKRAGEMVRANAVKLQMQALGEQNAVDLLDPVGTRYTYY